MAEYAELEYRTPPDYAEYVADRLLADGVIVPPCEIGQKIWDDLIKEICDLNNEKRKLERKITRLEKALKEREG